VDLTNFILLLYGQLAIRVKLRFWRRY